VAARGWSQKLFRLTSGVRRVTEALSNQITPDLLAPHRSRIEIPRAKVAFRDSGKLMDSFRPLAARVVAERGRNAQAAMAVGEVEDEGSPVQGEDSREAAAHTRRVTFRG
jgi:hypothetical protein